MLLEDMVLKQHSNSARREQIFIEEYSKLLISDVANGDIKKANERINELRKSVKQLDHYIKSKRDFDRIVEVIPSKDFFEKKLEGMI
ncbi:hypothetical protein MOC47_18585 [Bacillus spizizenii]|uniref:hypothetical protein n=1 Tax=Bacillus TaxID=1386 RepID=UPI0005CA2E40|nr:MULTISPECIES: hypothetical protein [Bacillus subtilis group]MCY7785093.1 hypothetical protein [Bacillus sp. S20C3]MCY8290329.1 hypothetical protein [Bacillus sp. N13C7]MCY8330794.1 hypothetical protein [Bacillus spizizenii]MCY8637718.1 hypothetical protein [Bacillus sp. S17B2]MCY9144723.1 hypothetical protein [Bacillus sp. T9C1]